VVELTGVITPRPERPRFFGLPIPMRAGHDLTSLDAVFEVLDALGRAPWLEGVLFEIEGLRVDQATAYAIRRAIAALGAARKKTASYLVHLDWVGYYIASAASEIIAPESADISLFGLGLSLTFMRDALARLGLRYEKLAIDEYKNAFDNLTRQEMS